MPFQAYHIVPGSFLSQTGPHHCACVALGEAFGMFCYRKQTCRSSILRAMSLVCYWMVCVVVVMVKNVKWDNDVSTRRSQFCAAASADVMVTPTRRACVTASTLHPSHLKMIGQSRNSFHHPQASSAAPSQDSSNVNAGVVCWGQNSKI